jgi:hypothetical protein
MPSPFAREPLSPDLQQRNVGGNLYYESACLCSAPLRGTLPTGRVHRRAFTHTRSGELDSDQPAPSVTRAGTEELVAFVLWLIAVILVIGGIVALVRGAILYGLVLIIVGLLVGPGGVSIFS